MQRFIRYAAAILAILLVTVFLAACGGNQSEPTSPPPSPQATTAAATASPTEPPPATEEKASNDLEIEDVVFTHALGEDMTPTDTAESFTPEQDVYVSVKLKGNPKEGVVGAVFKYHDTEIASTEIDLAQVRDEQGVIFVIGGNTYVGFTLSHENPFPPSDQYVAAISLDGEPAGEYSFQVTPPEDAIASKVLSATLAEDVDADTYEPYQPTDAFPADKQVFLAGRVDLGRLSTLSARWFIDGELDENGTRVITASENIEDTPFYFTYLPEDNWPVGKHKVVLYINDEPVGEYEFTIHSTEQ